MGMGKSKVLRKNRRERSLQHTNQSAQRYSEYDCISISSGDVYHEHRRSPNREHHVLIAHVVITTAMDMDHLTDLTKNC
jgi:hypothetical protein